MLATATRDSRYLLTLGIATQIEMILSVTSPKVAKASTVMSLSLTVLLTNFAKLNDPLDFSRFNQRVYIAYFLF